MRRISSLVWESSSGVVLMLTLFSALASICQCKPAIGTVRLSQSTGVIGSPNTVTVTATINDPNLLTNSVNLRQLNADGTTTVLGLMRDDGLSGDAYAGDGVYSLTTSINSNSATEVLLQASAAFKGVLQRVKSPVLAFYVQDSNAPQQALAALAQALAAGDVPTALSYVVPSDKSTQALNSLGQAGLLALASMMKNAIFIKSLGDLRVFEAPVTAPNGPITSQFTLIPGPGGRWLINTW